MVDDDDQGCADPMDDSESGVSRGAAGTVSPACDDGEDNDGDALIDFRVDGSGDPGCSGPTDRDEKSDRRALPCDDGLDNDGDGLGDFTADPGGGFESRTGRVTLGDPGCASPTDTSELNPNVQCDDGVDNDGDGVTDTEYLFVRVGGDAGCESPTDPSEQFECADGTDNDGDGTTDAGDPGCSGATDHSETGQSAQQRQGLLLACDNGLDDDGDGLVDFRVNGSGDPGCASPRDADERGVTGAPAPQVAATDSRAQQLRVRLVPRFPDFSRFLGRG